MTATRWAVLVAILGTASVLQPSVITPLGLPLGAPQLVVLAVAVIGMLDGPITGAVSGFAAGFVSDLTSQHLAGEAALVLTLTGCLAGLVATEIDRSVFVPLAVVALASAGAIAALAVVGIIATGGHVDAAALLRACSGAVLYDVLLTPVVFPILRALWSRLGMRVHA
jgi:rod shape-determining protein MreD